MNEELVIELAVGIDFGPACLSRTFNDARYSWGAPLMNAGELNIHSEGLSFLQTRGPAGYSSFYPCDHVYEFRAEQLDAMHSWMLQDSVPQDFSMLQEMVGSNARRRSDIRGSPILRLSIPRGSFHPSSLCFTATGRVCDFDFHGGCTLDDLSEREAYSLCHFYPHEQLKGPPCLTWGCQEIYSDKESNARDVRMIDIELYMRENQNGTGAAVKKGLMSSSFKKKITVQCFFVQLQEYEKLTKLLLPAMNNPDRIRCALQFKGEVDSRRGVVALESIATTDWSMRCRPICLEGRHDGKHIMVALRSDQDTSKTSEKRRSNANTHPILRLTDKSEQNFWRLLWVASHLTHRSKSAIESGFAHVPSRVRDLSAGTEAPMLPRYAHKNRHRFMKSRLTLLDHLTCLGLASSVYIGMFHSSNLLLDSSNQQPLAGKHTRTMPQLLLWSLAYFSSSASIFHNRDQAGDSWQRTFLLCGTAAGLGCSWFLNATVPNACLQILPPWIAGMLITSWICHAKFFAPVALDDEINQLNDLEKKGTTSS